MTQILGNDLEKAKEYFAECHCDIASKKKNCETAAKYCAHYLKNEKDNSKNREEAKTLKEKIDSCLNNNEKKNNNKPPEKDPEPGKEDSLSFKDLIEEGNSLYEDYCKKEATGIYPKLKSWIAKCSNKCSNKDEDFLQKVKRIEIEHPAHYCRQIQEIIDILNSY